MKRKLIVIALLTALMMTFVACGSNTPQENSHANTKAVELNVSAAASLTDALSEIKELYIEDHPHININYNFAASGQLSKQIAEGAPVNIFISANQDKMDELEEQGLILEDTRQDLLSNIVVLIAGKDSNINDFMDLTEPSVEKIGFGEPASVPVGTYGKQVLESLNIWGQVEQKLLLAKNVRQVLSYVDSGNVDAGIVYKTDAMLATNAVVVAEAPKDSHEPVVYPMAVLKESRNIDDAKQFLDFLTSKEATVVLDKYGFTSIN